MKILLDTNIIIHREAARVLNPDIGILFNWLDRLKYSKYIHPITVEELMRYKDAKTVEAIGLKIKSYNLIRNIAPFTQKIQDIVSEVDVTENDINDTKLLNEVYFDRVDILISEDKQIHYKANLLGIQDRVFRIDEFLEKVTTENPDLVNYKVLAVKKVDFGELDLSNAFFNSFREDYYGFDKWFNKKSDEIAYVCFSAGVLSAFLYIKLESADENYSDIIPAFSRKKRLKIGTFKVVSNGFRIGERFLKIIFDNALQYRVDEIYVTIFDKRQEQNRLISLLEEWGFQMHGIKQTISGEEKVFVKNFDRAQTINKLYPKKTFPFSSGNSRIFIVPIYAEYHTELFPDSILKTESPKDFTENEPHRNALSKVYISRSHYKNLEPGDLILFYRTGTIYTGVVTTVGIVESVQTNIPNAEMFIKLCRKRSVFSDDQLKAHWNYYPNLKPFIVNFLYAYSLKRRPNLKWLNENGIIPDIYDMPRGFREISRQQFNKVLQYSIGNESGSINKA